MKIQGLTEPWATVGNLNLNLNFTPLNLNFTPLIWQQSRFQNGNKMLIINEIPGVFLMTKETSPHTSAQRFSQYVPPSFYQRLLAILVSRRHLTCSGRYGAFGCGELRVVDEIKTADFATVFAIDFLKGNTSTPADRTHIHT